MTTTVKMEVNVTVAPRTWMNIKFVSAHADSAEMTVVSIRVSISGDPALGGFMPYARSLTWACRDYGKDMLDSHLLTSVANF